MAGYVLARNTLPGPLVVARNGRSLGGGEWGAVDPEDPTVKRLGDLLVIPDATPTGDDLDPAVTAAIAEVAERNGTASPAVDDGTPAPLGDDKPTTRKRA